MSQLDRAYKLKTLLKGQITYLPYISKEDLPPPKKAVTLFPKREENI